MSGSSRTKLAALATVTTASPTLAFAHGGGDHVHGLIAGIEHPILGPDHLLAMVAVGMIAARMGGRSLLFVPAAFVVAMSAGAALGAAGLALPSVETAIALSLVALGAVVSIYRPLPLSSAMALVALFGIFHGNAHGLEIPETANGAAYAAGFLAGTSALHAAGVGFGSFLSRWPSLLRLAGTGASAFGAMLALQLV